jgi:hypothetical protein
MADWLRSSPRLHPCCVSPRVASDGFCTSLACWVLAQEAGIVRVRSADGWCSAQTADGQTILRKQERTMVSMVSIAHTENHTDPSGKGSYVAYHLHAIMISQSE